MMAEPLAPDAPSVRSVLRSGGRAIVVVVVVGFSVVGIALLAAVRGYSRTRRGAIALQVFSRLTLVALGVRVVSQGSVRSGPSLVVANRLCWLDVLVLAAAGSMVPLADPKVEQHPSIAPIAARVGALLVDQAHPRQLPAVVEQITATLRRGHRVLVFPEGAEQPGNGRKPFHRAVFQSAIDAAVVISPVALSYRGASPAAGIVDEALLCSLWRTLRGGPLTVRVQWLPVIPAVAGSGHRSDHRAAAAARAEWVIARATGRPVQSRPAAARTPVLALLPTACPVTVLPPSGPAPMDKVA